MEFRIDVEGARAIAGELIFGAPEVWFFDLVDGDYLWYFAIEIGI